MKIEFLEKYEKAKEVNGKYFIEVPENMWERFEQRGRIKSKCVISGLPYIVSLIPKGNGRYVFQLTKEMILQSDITYDDLIEIVLCKINSPIAKELISMKNELSKNIMFRNQISSNTCGQACIAMLLNEDVEVICREVGKKTLGIGKMIELLNTKGVNNSQRNIRISKKILSQVNFA